MPFLPLICVKPFTPSNLIICFTGEKGDFNQLASSSARRMCAGLCLYQHLAPLNEDKFTPVFANACPSRIAHWFSNAFLPFIWHGASSINDSTVG